MTFFKFKRIKLYETTNYNNIKGQKPEYKYFINIQDYINI